MIITLTGQNTFAIAEAQAQLTEAFTKKHGAHGIERVNGEGLSTDRLPDLLQGATLFAPVRLVILQNISGNKAVCEVLAEQLPGASSDTTIVIAEPSLDKRTKLYKFLKTTGKFTDTPLPTERELAAWVQKKVEAGDGTISPTDASHLVQRCNADQWRIKHEIDKLLSFNPTITKVAIDDLVEPGAEGSAFELLDAALTGRRDELTKQLAGLRVSEDPYRFFGLLGSQIFTLAVVVHAGTRSPDAIARETGLHPFVVRKTTSVAKRLSPAKIKQLVDDVALCDVQLKSTGTDPWQLIGHVLNKIASR